MMKDVQPIHHVSIVGAGHMGIQIGFQCAINGYTTWLIDVSQDALAQAHAKHNHELNQYVETHALSTDEKTAVHQRLHYTTNLMEGVTQVDLVIEAVPEQLQLKRHVFSQLDQLCSAHTILATNSSSIRVSRIEDATQRPSQVLNMHFYQPSRAPMVELMRGSSTSDTTMNVAYQFIHTLRLRPVIVHKESTGFIFNRI